MSYNLTEKQQDLLRWFVQRARDGSLPEEFYISWHKGGATISGYTGEKKDIPRIIPSVLEVLADAKLLFCKPAYSSSLYGEPGSTRLSGMHCVLREDAYNAVDSNFHAPDTSFLTHLTPLADVTNLDNELKTRCLPILGAGSADPKMWDAAVRNAGVILEERLRDVGAIADPDRVGRDLVNDVFGNRGMLESKFSNDSERQGYRDLYAGIVGAFRNPYAHRLVDPIPEDGGAFVVFVNLLLKMLEDLR